MPIFLLFESLCVFVARSMWHAIVKQWQQQFNIARPAPIKFKSTLNATAKGVLRVVNGCGGV